MDLSAIFQIRTKKFWWMDVIFYFVISLLVATVFCYGIFWLLLVDTFCFHVRMVSGLAHKYFPIFGFQNTLSAGQLSLTD